MEYHFRDIERKWQEKWKAGAFRTGVDPSKLKYYVLDMFPYPSGSGLHVGHPLGYIASDIVARYKRHKGFNVLHPMGYDAFGLPAEQYAIQTGQHPAITTEQNIKRFREQLDKIGLSYDWDREVKTCDPSYYKWTQWIFLKLFDSWYNKTSNKAEPLGTLIAAFEKNGNDKLNACCDDDTPEFKAEEWKKFSEKEKREILMKYRIAYLSDAYVWWCTALGSVLANDEVKDGVSERGGYPVERKLMKQWSMRITAYSERLLQDLEGLEWSESIKESQRNWIGKSEGSTVRFQVSGGRGEAIEVFTTRPDTIFGVTFLTLAPEHELVSRITTAAQKDKVGTYLNYAKGRSERERMSEVKKITGEFTGAYAEHPFSGEKIPVWVGDYVLAGYGTGAVMGVPAHDSRDHAFAKHFKLEIRQVISAPDGLDIQKESWDEKSGTCINSDFINGLEVKEAINKCIGEIEKRKLGVGKVNYRLRNAVFGRQRYWGEPIPVYYKDGIPYAVDEKDLPVVLPEVDKYLPTETGEPPLARAIGWKYKGKYDYEHTTMPGWAGSSWYYLRYMDAKNDKEFVSKEAVNYWKEIDFYLGGAEHATGHLLYVRFWTKALYDLGFIPINEPARKLVNQGMIQGNSTIVRVRSEEAIMTETDGQSFSPFNNFYIVNFKEVDLGENVFDRIFPSEFVKVENGCFFIDKNCIEKTHKSFPQFQAYWLDKGEDFVEVRSGIEKMSKSKFNVVNPDDMCEQYGADTYRMYEMFLGPLEQSKPWNTNGITGVSGFLRKYWKLFQQGTGNREQGTATKEELKTLHKTIKKITEEIERGSFNTCVSHFMICVNELTDLKCNKREILEPLTILLSPFAPHVAEELWEKMGHTESIMYAPWPIADEKNLVDDSFAYPIQFNGKTRFNLELSLSLTNEQIEKEVLAAEQTQKYLAGNPVKKVIVVPKRIVNLVI